jgi:hypothetical protein
MAQFMELGQIVREEDGVGVGAPAAEAIVFFGKGAASVCVFGREEGRLQRATEGWGVVV